jgi:biotin synthase
MDKLDKLFSMDDDLLFLKAAELGSKRNKIYWSPVVINASCKTDPPCRHCKWESFKHDRPHFGNRPSMDDILYNAETSLKAGATNLLIASGWMGYNIPEYFCDYTRAIKERFNAQAYGLFGAISLSSLKMLKEAGMDGYQCGLESPDPQTYLKFRPGGDSLEDRKTTLLDAKTAGLKIWSGFLIGLGIENQAVKNGLHFLKYISADSIAIQPFVPFPNTHLQTEDPANPYRWARLMAISRLYAGEDTDIIATENSGAYENFMEMTGANGFFIFPQK